MELEKLMKLKLSSALLVSVAACSVPLAQSEPDATAAVLSESKAASYAELESVLSEALQTPVTLAKDALTRESVLVIERKPLHSLDKPGIDGRLPGKPEKFRLMTDGADCWLLQLSDGRRWDLREASCVPAGG